MSSYQLPTILAIRHAFNALGITEVNSDCERNWIFIKTVQGKESKLHYPKDGAEILKGIYRAENYLGTSTFECPEFYLARHTIYEAAAGQITFASIKEEENILKYQLKGRARNVCLEQAELDLTENLEIAWLLMSGYTLVEVFGVRLEVLTPNEAIRYPEDYRCTCPESLKRGGGPCIHMKLRQAYLSNRSKFIDCGAAVQRS
jgi:hypothetical protein